MATTATMATPMMLWIKESGKEAVQISAKPSDTVASLKTLLSLQNVSLRLRCQHLGHSRTLEQCGVAEGDVITLHPNTATPPGFKSRNEYVADHRLKTGKQAKTFKHAQLHQATRACILEESVVARKKWRTSAKR